MRYLSFDIGLRNLGVCELIVLDNKTFMIHRWFVYDIVDLIPHCQTFKQLNITDFPVVLKYLTKHLFPIPYILHNIDHIILEQQPSKCNIKIKLFANMIYQHFCSILSTIKYGHVLTSVRFVHGKLKYNKRWLEEFGYMNKKRNYLQRKKLSYDLTLNLLKKYESI